MDGAHMGALVRALDYNRGATEAHPDQQGFKEWLHFCVYAPGVDLLANFSSVHRTHGPAGVDRRAVVLARVSQWVGSVEHDRRGVMPPGGVGAAVGRSSVTFDGDCYRLVVKPEDCDVEAQVQLTPVTLPSPTHNVEVDNGPPINWVVIPKLEASGWVRVAGETTRFERAPAYHDHNWGSFRWGHDFAWEWGYCLSPDPEVPHSIVVVRLTNRRRTCVLAQAIFLWKGARQARIFRGNAVSARHFGLLNPQRVFKLPRVMSLVRGGRGTEVPRRYEIRGSRDGDELTVTFEPNDVAQVVLPNDDDLDFTVIHEVQGRFRAEGRIRGEFINYGGNGVFEFLGS